MGKIIGIYNLKGGTGKTSAAINLSSFLEESGADVLAVDLDTGQCNFTAAYLPAATEEYNSNQSLLQLSDFLANEHIDQKDAIYPVSVSLNARTKPKHIHIDMLPSFPGERQKFFPSSNLLKDRITKYRDNYDYIILDFPPESPYADLEKNEYNLVSLGLCAADEILVPCSTDSDSLSGFFSLIEHIELVRRELNPGLYKVSFFINNYNRKFLAEREFVEYCETLSPIYSGIIIPTSGILKSSRVMQRPLAWYNSNSAVAIAYKALADYVAK